MFKLVNIIKSEAFTVSRRFKHIRLSPLADAFNYGPNNIQISGKKVTGLFGVSELDCPTGFSVSLDDCFSNCHSLLYEAKDTNRKRKIVQILDDMSDVLCQSADLADCIRTLHPDPEFQNAANAVCSRVGLLVESLNTDFDLYYAASKAASISPLSHSPESDSDEVDKRVLDLFVEDFKMTGVHLEEGSSRNDFLKAADENLQLGVEFSQIAHNPIHMSTKLLRNISPDVDWTALQNKHLYGPAYHSPDQFIRALTYSIFYRPLPGQEQLLTNLLESRHRMATSSGLDCYLTRVIQPSSLAESAERVGRFLDKLTAILSPLATTTALCHLKPISVALKTNPNHEFPSLVTDDHTSGRLHQWDLPFLINQGRDTRDQQKLLPYFSLGACMEGVNQLSDCLFGLRLEVESALPGEVWHPDVVKVAVYTSDALIHASDHFKDEWESRFPIGPGVRIGTVYCDFFDRPGKPAQDCHYTIRGGRHTQHTMFEATSPYQYPIVVLQLGLGKSPANQENGTPLLLTANQVENLFHEWGHALHSMIARTRFQHVTGTRCSTDFAELPSTLFEFFALDSRVTCQYARHFDTGEAPNSKEELDSIIRLDTIRGFGQSVEIMQQLMHAVLDQRLHADHPASVLSSVHNFNESPASAQLLSKLFKEYCDDWLVESNSQTFISESPIATTHRFGHLVGYGGRYYSYLMARAAAGLVWRKGFASDPWSSSFGRKYRDHLRFGGERSPAYLMAHLLEEERNESSLTPESLADGLFNEICAGEELAKELRDFSCKSSLRRIR